MNYGKKPSLEMVNICKNFPGVRALDKVCLKAYPGEVIGLVGENGAGKSTLMNIMGGVIFKDSGQILIAGEVGNPKSPLDAQSMGISFIHQEPTLFPTLSIAENIFLTSFPLKRFSGFIDHRKIYLEADNAIKKLGIKINPRLKVENILMGQRQIVEIARAISSNAKIIIFDEPTSSLTVKEKNKLFEVIHSLKNQGVTMIYISHLLEEIFEICDRIYVLRDGRNVDTVLPAETSQQQVIELMIGGSLKSFFPDRHVPPGKEILKAEGLTRYGVLQNISLTIRSGEIVGLWGLIGSGRTELARALLGLDPIDEGRVWFDRQAISLSSGGQVLKKSGFIPENRRDEGIFPTMSVRDNISMANLKSLVDVTKLFINRKKERYLTQEIIKKLRIVVTSIEQKVDNLSGGNQQKVVVARWLQRCPILYVLDEPTRGLDVGAKAEIHNLTGSLADQGAAILLISSEIEELLGMSDRILVLKKGKIVAEFERNIADKQKLMHAATEGGGNLI
ncbi:MAG: sugar ABC transporter ATP-binding protein [Actinobacteria bacterium]|nr:sugar ABC transporter ATP-binding protein [Actinomycetota bacterium]